MSVTFRDIAYASQSASQKLDVFLPTAAGGSFPVIVYLHPGGFTMGNKEMVQPLLATILAHGYAVVSADYRLAGEARFPAQIFDAKSAIRWTRANARRYNFNPDKIVPWGISAGSTLAALLGTTENIRHQEDLSAGNPAESSKVNAVVSWYGPMDFLMLNEQRLKLGQKPVQDSEASGEFQMMGGSLAEVPDNYRAASAIYYVNKSCPPFYIQHGTADQVIPYLQSVNFAAALEAAIGKTRVRLQLVEGAGHFDKVQSSAENINAALDFLNEQLNE